jgi:hypothetical protein
LGTASATVTVAQGAMPTGTTLSIYPVASSSTLDALLPAANSYVASFDVSWENPDGTSLTATTPVTMTITDPAISAGDTIYSLTSTGLVVVGKATVNGTVTITFTSDPIYLITSTHVAQGPISITSTSGHFETPLRLVTSGGAGTGAVTYSVIDGTASGCAINVNNTLTSSSAGTCIVTATKASDASYDAATSLATTIALVLPATPSKVTTSIAPGSSSLSAGAKTQLRTLAKKLVDGASLTITGYAKNDARLAKSRASAVARYLESLVRVKVTLKTVVTSSSNHVIVVTNKQ